MKQLKPWMISLCAGVGALLATGAVRQEVLAQSARPARSGRSIYLPHYERAGRVASSGLVVSISSVGEGSSNTRIIGKASGESSGSDSRPPHFEVVLRNASDKPIKLWAEDCSFGYDLLRLEIVAINGKPEPKPIIVFRNINAWSSNGIRRVTLEPGDVSVREVRLYAYKPGERCKHPFEVASGYDYRGFPAIVDDSRPLVYRIRAVYESLPVLKGAHTENWSGRAVSETREYYVRGYYPE